MAKLTQRKIAHQNLKKYGMLRLSELREHGVSATTISRMVKDGEIDRLSCGLYQLEDSEWDTYHSFAQVTKILRGKGVICLMSALEYHGLTDWLTDHIWVAIEKNKWIPQCSRPQMNIVQYSNRMLTNSQEMHQIEGVNVKIFGVAKTVTDCFRHLRSVGLDVAIEGLEKSLKYQKTTRSELELHAKKGRVWTVMEPYIDAAVNKIPLYNWDFSGMSELYK